MKTIRKNIDKWMNSLDQRWDEMPAERQHKYVLYFFAFYLLVTAGVIFNIWYQTAGSDNRMIIEHIENPVRGKEIPASQLDSLSTIVKEKIYERK